MDPKCQAWESCYTSFVPSPRWPQKAYTWPIGPIQAGHLMNEHAEFWSKVAERYDSVIDRQMGSDSRARLRERIAAEEGTFGRAAEFCCGTGFFTDSIASRSDTLEAVDLAPGMIQVARSRCPAPKITFRNEDCQKTSIGNASLDTAFLSLVIHFT